jgi:thermitase
MLPNLSVSLAAPSRHFVPGEVIIGLKAVSIGSFRPVISALGATVKREIPALNAVVARVTPGAEESFVRSMRGRAEVAFVEQNGICEAAIVPNDPYWSFQWNMPMIKANAAWDTYLGSSEVVIAIVDTGINYNHPDLAANYKSGGYDWVNYDFDPMDDYSHGSHCAGIAAAVLNNGLGVAGLAQCKLWAEKVLDSEGFGSWDDLASGIIHATDQGVNVISMSLGGYGYSSLLDSACTYAWNHGVVLVAAAGNDNVNIDTNPFYPASFSTVIAVSATTSSDLRWSSSNYGSKIEVSAPGASVYSTVLSNGYDYKTGTSMACPHVAGLVALIRSYKPQLTNSQVRSALQTAVDDKGTPGKDIYYGYGRINCQKIISGPEAYQYRFQLSPFADRVWVNVTPQPGGYLINGKVNLTSPSPNYPAPVLGWASGDSFYMTFDYRKTSGSYDLGFLVGTISTASGKLYKTSDGVTWIGPTTVTLVSFAQSTEDQPDGATAVEPAAIQFADGLNPPETAVSQSFQYHFTMSPFIDKVYVNVTYQPGGMLIYGLANKAGDILRYPAPVLGWGVGNDFYMPFDYRTVIGSGAYELGFIVGTISTASGKIYGTSDGVTWIGPTSVTLVPFAESVDGKT